MTFYRYNTETIYSEDYFTKKYIYRVGDRLTGNYCAKGKKTCLKISKVKIKSKLLSRSSDLRSAIQTPCTHARAGPDIRFLLEMTRVYSYYYFFFLPRLYNKTT